ncbi:uncharacterized protein MELLADRAFT_110324 [Melampsora larici-populina 98AG31]|uniref:Uncharacterized protein n=1 Tax=Melampsora larici-populina (strain 98AG31 / pathotype 3-4-7) TaxID=747676 RepID=F4RZE1_MELLP|nr:uncharacterized protein MELLADRAFT_110324 [Melampsora larici-populina 98AG31]EGG02210.1 hypothetical protein MELLADRAFT_110324 [Melampsora larici-populina 98AG31]
MFGFVKAGKNVADGATDMGRGVQSLGTNAAGGAGDLRNIGSTVSTGTETPLLRASPDNLGQADDVARFSNPVDDVSKFSNPDPMLTGASQIGMNTARQTTNTLQGSRSVLSLGSVLKSFGNSIYRSYYRLTAKFYGYLQRSASRQAENLNEQIAYLRANKAPDRLITNLSKKRLDAFGQTIVNQQKESQALMKAGGGMNMQ